MTFSLIFPLTVNDVTKKALYGRNTFGCRIKLKNERKIISSRLLWSECLGARGPVMTDLLNNWSIFIIWYRISLASKASVSGNWLAFETISTLENFFAVGLVIGVLNIQSEDFKILNPCFPHPIHCLQHLKVKNDLVFALDDHQRAVVSNTVMRPLCLVESHIC